MSGKLYFVSGSDGAVHKVDLATGAHTMLGIGDDPMVTKQGTILCVVQSNLADAPESLTTYRHIKDLDLNDPLYGQHFSFPRQSPDGTKVAYATLQGKIVVLDFQTGAQIALIDDPNVILGYGRPSWTPDGRLVFAGESGSYGIFITDAAFKNPTRIDPQLTDVTEAMVSHDGKSVAFVRTKHVWKMGIDGSNPVQIDTSDDSGVEDELPYWSPDDTVIYWHGYAGDVYFHSAADGTGPTTQLFKLYPDLQDKVLITDSTKSMDWVR